MEDKVTNKFFKKIMQICIIMLLVFSLIITSCTMPVSEQSSSKNDTITEKVVINNSDGSQSRASYSYLLLGPYGLFHYRHGLRGTLLGKRTEGWHALLNNEYYRWRQCYVTSNGAGGNLRVQRDITSFYDTVSEGIAYGMLLAVYFDDYDTFYKLYKYCLAHLVSSKRYLMHWKVDKDGNDVSEFYIKVPHKRAWVDKNTLWKKDKCYPLDRVTDEDRTYIVNPDGTINNPDPSRYLKACKNSRDLSSAADADFDIAAALVIASYKWGSYFKYEAAKMLKAIAEYDIDYRDSYIIRNGTAWGDIACWNPSYFTPAWFRMFVQFIEENKSDATFTGIMDKPNCDETIRRINTSLEVTMQQMEKLKRDSSILPPDWCDSSGSYFKRSYGSDRLYYLDENGDGNIDDQNHDGIINDDDGVGMMSNNFYYDAVRTSWRLAHDYAWYGTTRSKNLVEPMRAFFNSKNHGLNLVDGYSKYGYRWTYYNRDGFNNIQLDSQGGLWPSTTFYAMCATAFMINENGQGDADIIAQKVIEKHDYNDTYYEYYGNTLRLISLLFISGRFTSPYAKVAFQSEGNGRYVCADNNRGTALHANRDVIDQWETFDIVSLNHNNYWSDHDLIGIRSYLNNKFIRYSKTDGINMIKPLDTGVGEYNNFLISYHGFSLYSLRAKVNSYTWKNVCSDYHVNNEHWPLCLNRDGVGGTWEYFRIIER